MVKNGQALREVKHIHAPKTRVPNSQWHVHGKNREK